MAQTDRRVRFRQAFYDSTYGLFKKGEVYDVPDEVKLPTRDIEYIRGAPSTAPADMHGELEDGERVLNKDAAAAANAEVQKRSRRAKPRPVRQQAK